MTKQFVILNSPVWHHDNRRGIDKAGAAWVPVPENRETWADLFQVFPSSRAAGKAIKAKIARYEELKDTPRPSDTEGHNAIVREQNFCVDFLHSTVIQI